MAETQPLVRVAVEIVDRGDEPEWHKDRTLYGPWRRWVATMTLPGGTRVDESGLTPSEALSRVASGCRDEDRRAIHEALAPGQDERGETDAR